MRNKIVANKTETKNRFSKITQRALRIFAKKHTASANEMSSFGNGTV